MVMSRSPGICHSACLLPLPYVQHGLLPRKSCTTKLSQDRGLAGSREPVGSRGCGRPSSLVLGPHIRLESIGSAVATLNARYPSSKPPFDRWRIRCTCGTSSRQQGARPTCLTLENHIGGSCRDSLHAGRPPSGKRRHQEYRA